MEETRSYYIIERKEWRDYLNIEAPDVDVSLTHEQLDRLVSLNDTLTLKDATEIYEPLTQLITLYLKNYLRLGAERNHFLGIDGHPSPFIIGISGSVAVGKSTTARLLQLILSQLFPDRAVDLITTDGFLYPSAELEARNLMQRKGFPESYDMERLRNFLVDVKDNKKHLKIPKYSHEHYDILPNEFISVENPQILIIEGINVLQITDNGDFFVGDFADLSIYVDAKTEDIEQWFKQRFRMLIDKARENPKDYYHTFAQWHREKQEAYAERVWREINLPNLEEYILPTRSRADFVLHKQADHYVDSIWMKKY
ncbi:MAG: type I pantothenate kinase [Aerococcus sp.]|nr:type I pantothenate kinase [Aerococcus sp.]